MPGNTNTANSPNLAFTTGVVNLTSSSTVPLNPVNTANYIWDCGVPYVFVSMTTLITGAPASDTVVLEGTLDGSTWVVLATSTSTTGDTQFATGGVPFTNLRARCSAVSGGTSPTINVFVSVFQNQPATAADSTPVSPFVPAGTNILSGSATAANTVTTQVILTVPAGRTWFGSLNLALSNTAAAGQAVSANINTVGTNPVPLAAVNLLTVTNATVGASVAGEVTESAATGSNIYVQAPAGNSITLNLTNTSATTNTSFANANGVLL